MEIEKARLNPKQTEQGNTEKICFSVQAKNNYTKNYIDGKYQDHCETPAREQAKFWRSLWKQTMEHNKNDERVERATEIPKLEKQLRRMQNWKAPGTDLVQGFWLKRLVNLHERIVGQLLTCLNEFINVNY